MARRGRVSQGTQIEDSWAWTMAGLTVGVVVGRGRGEQGGKKQATVTEQH